ncbi:hypothetical protein FORC64_0800 [Escherichia coli]|nr:hypothetical protein FORC64_0800 [Escherichia coli]EKI16896.1 putative membrane protein [Escherichia coli TW15901]EKI25429.1 putative membrane protein [Escherichia coli TW00353]
MQDKYFLKMTILIAFLIILTRTGIIYTFGSVFLGIENMALNK